MKILLRSFLKQTNRLVLEWVPLSSTQTPSVQHISSTFGPHLFSPKNPSVPHQKPLSSTQTPQFHTKKPSVPPPLSSTPKNPQFHTKKALYKRALQFFFSQTENAVWNGRKFDKFNCWRAWLRTRRCSRKNSTTMREWNSAGIKWIRIWTKMCWFKQLNLSNFLPFHTAFSERKKTVKLAYGTEGVELRGFWCGTEGFVLNWGVFGGELRDFGAEKEWPFCVELMCWTEGGVELRGT